MKTQDVLKNTASILDGLEVLQKLTHLGGAAAEITLATVKRVIDVLVSGSRGHVTTEDIEKTIDALRAELESNDSKIDAAIDSKFPSDR